MTSQANTSRLAGLYLISDDRRSGAESLATSARAALSGGARIVQYRDKGDDYARRFDEALALRALAHEFSVPLLINDDVDLAAEVGADGVHLGRDDPAVHAARERLPVGSLARTVHGLAELL